MTPPGYAADWPVPAVVKTWQTTRLGGVSHEPYASLNLGTHVGDSVAAVADNRARLCSSLGLPAEPSWLEQVHGTRILSPDRGETGPADGAITANPGVVLAVMTADCLPVLLCAEDGSEIAVAHAGWRGLAAGVLARAVATFAAEPVRLFAWLGPAIGAGAFEVGTEVREAFVATDPGCQDAFSANRRGRWQADLQRLARRQLTRAGVSRIFGTPSCTFTDAENYFSHRRQAPCGRMATLIWLDRGR